MPVVSPCLVTIVSDGSSEARQRVGELAHELREALVTSGPSVVAKELATARLRDPTSIPEFHEKGRLKLLVLVGDGNTEFTYHSWYAYFPALLPVFPKDKPVAQSFKDPC